MESILGSIKQLLGVSTEDSYFDAEITMHINSVFSILTQLGVGPNTGYRITTPMDSWEDFLGDRIDLEIIKSYIYNKVRLMYDPPQNSFLVKTIEDQCKEFEWRLNVQADCKQKETE